MEDQIKKFIIFHSLKIHIIIAVGVCCTDMIKRETRTISWGVSGIEVL